MKSNLFKILFTALIAISLFSCNKSDPEIVPALDGKVIVINQGNFTEQSASISLYNENTKQIENRIYETANGVSIGASVISGIITPAKEAVLICNNPDKIIFIDAATGKSKGVITEGLASPRNAIYTPGYLFVTNWDYEHIVAPSGFWEFNKSYVAVYNNYTKALVKKVLVGTDAEGIALFGNYLFVAVKEGVRVLDISSDDMPIVSTIRSSQVTGSAKHLTFDESGTLWASFPDKGLVQINPSSLQVLAVVEVPVDYMDGYITSDAKGKNILTYNTTFDSSYNPERANIYSVNVSTKTVTPLFEGTYFYGVGVSPATGNIFTAEVSFTSNSVLKVVGADGTLRDSATAGIGTCRYLFF